MNSTIQKNDEQERIISFTGKLKKVGETMNDLKITEYKNIRVLTTQQIAEAYETDSKTISYNFNHNKER